MPFAMANAKKKDILRLGIINIYYYVFLNVQSSKCPQFKRSDKLLMTNDLICLAINKVILELCKATWPTYYITVELT